MVADPAAKAARDTADDRDVERGGEASQAADSTSGHAPPCGNVFLGSVSNFASAADAANRGPSAPLDLFTEAHYFLESAAFIYSFYKLRELARAGDVSDADAILVEPIGYSKILELTWSHRGEIEDHLGPDYDFFVDVVDEAEKQIEVEAFRQGKKDGYKTLGSTPEKFGIITFDDEQKPGQEGGLVYMIEVDCLAKRVVVTFRGTANARDVRADMNLFMRTIPNPLVDVFEGQPRTLCIHGGFADYLYNASAKDKNLDADEYRAGTKCREIIDKVRGVLEANPGFDLYTTGHSMGGALASLFAFELACRTDLNLSSAVTCIALAPPRFANLSFRNAFQQLEKQGKLRCLSIINILDPVPLMPSRFLCFCSYALCSPDKLYRHVGVQLKLLPRDWGFRVFYRMRSPMPLLGFLMDLIRGAQSLIFSMWFVDMMLCLGIRYHGNPEYSSRLKANWAELKELTLESVYDQIKGGDRETLQQRVHIKSLGISKRKGPVGRRSAGVKNDVRS